MDATTQVMVKHGNPLGKSTNWIVIALEAVALIVLGLFVLTDKAGAGAAILQLTALVLLVAGVAAVVSEFRSGASDLVLFTAFRAGVGVTIGAIGMSRWFWSAIDLNVLRHILGWGLIAYAAITIVGVLLVRKLGPDSWGGLGVGAMTAVLGIILLVNDDASASNTLRVLGIVFLVAGVVLAGIAWLRFKGTRDVAV